MSSSSCSSFLLITPLQQVSSPPTPPRTAPPLSKERGAPWGSSKNSPLTPATTYSPATHRDSTGCIGFAMGPRRGAHQFFCELEEERCGQRGLMRVAHIDMSEPCSTCPPPLAQYWANDIKVCGPAVERGCDSVIFPVHGVEYNYVCDRTVGYSFYAPIGLYRGTDQSYTIDQLYLRGLSITHGAPGSRNHIWSYVAGLREYASYVYNCPCSAHPRAENLTPDYVGDHFYCDTATYYHANEEWYTNNALWDGKD